MNITNAAFIQLFIPSITYTQNHHISKLCKPLPTAYTYIIQMFSVLKYLQIIIRISSKN